MKQYTSLWLFTCGILLSACINSPEVKIEKVGLEQVDTISEVPIPNIPDELKVSAYLIYEDGSLSSFDLLDDNEEVLWNTIAGGGDAGKPSDNCKIRLTGKLDDLHVRISNGNKIVNDQRLPNFTGDFEFIIKNTGCDVVKVMISKDQKKIFEREIPFHCGE